MCFRKIDKKIQSEVMRAVAQPTPLNMNCNSMVGIATVQEQGVVTKVSFRKTFELLQPCKVTLININITGQNNE